MSARRNRRKQGDSGNWGGAAILRVVVVGLLFAGIGFGYVMVMNEQVHYGRQIAVLEQEIAETEEEIRLSNSRIATILERERLKERLARAGSSLRPIVAEEVIELVVENEIHGQASEVVYSDEEVTR